jgi:hypothetical protein
LGKYYVIVLKITISTDYIPSDNAEHEYLEKFLANTQRFLLRFLILINILKDKKMKLIYLKTLVLEKYIICRQKIFVYKYIFKSYQKVSREYDAYELKIIKELGKLTP